MAAGSVRRAVRRRVSALLLASAVLAAPPVAPVPHASGAIATVAVFPVENLSGAAVPAAEVRRFFIEALRGAGVRVVSIEALEAFLTRYRVRYTGGIEAETAVALRAEAGVDAVLIPTVELFSAAAPPRCAITARLVSIASMPTVVWAADAGLAGDEAPGLFDLGLVHDPARLQARALRQISASLLAHVQGAQPEHDLRPSGKFRPKTHFRDAALDPGGRRTIAVVPFVNVSTRRNAGEIVTLLFVRHLSSVPRFRVLDAGVVRRQLVDARIVMADGLSLADADTVAALTEADFVLGGRVIRYDDPEGAAAEPQVEFSAVVVERATRRVVWSSSSYNKGRDGMSFFGRGASRTAHVMATQMVSHTAAMIAGGER
jgi:TolB-like protein